MRKKSLQAAHNPLSSSEAQLDILSDLSSQKSYPLFQDKIKGVEQDVLRAGKIDVFQINIGKMCNQTCAHCHVDAGPDRKEIMTRETLQLCLDKIIDHDLSTVDITGGAPEMNPHFRWFVKELSLHQKQIMVRSNLTILLANPKYYDLPEFFRDHKVVVISSLPHFAAARTDAQRGEGVFDKSIEALRRLNKVGYGMGSDLLLHLVYNPSGTFLPDTQESLEREFKTQLQERFGIQFSSLYTITNMPISRFLEYLIRTDALEDYMERLIQAFNPHTISGLMCRNTISVGWDGYLFDCDFNQMLDLNIGNGKPLHLRDISLSEIEHRNIITHQHCYGCTAGAGSSCGGEIT
ncbi:MAG: arsenosugar biosynthesis radical SAM protein ArsS [Cytophagales bacterium]|nr:arsenosugar biosynthesis radical SAM protein ArsS [Cytophagales bacterium]